MLYNLPRPQQAKCHSPYWWDEADDEPIQANMLQRKCGPLRGRPSSIPVMVLSCEAHEGAAYGPISNQTWWALAEYAERRAKPKSLVADRCRRRARSYIGMAPQPDYTPKAYSAASGSINILYVTGLAARAIVKSELKAA